MERLELIEKVLGKDARANRGLLTSGFKFCTSHGIDYKQDDLALAFANHIIELHKRLESGEDLPEFDNSISNQVPFRYRHFANILLKSLFPKHRLPESEIILLAIHLSVAAPRLS